MSLCLTHGKKPNELKITGAATVTDSRPSGSCLQCVLRSPVHPDPSVRAGGESGSLAVGRQSVQSPRHFLLLQRHGALHQRPRPADRLSEGKSGAE